MFCLGKESCAIYRIWGGPFLDECKYDNTNSYEIQKCSMHPHKKNSSFNVDFELAVTLVRIPLKTTLTRPPPLTSTAG